MVRSWLRRIIYYVSVANWRILQSTLFKSTKYLSWSLIFKQCHNFVGFLVVCLRSVSQSISRAKYVQYIYSVRKSIIRFCEIEKQEYIYIYVTLLVFLHAQRCDKAFLFFTFTWQHTSDTCVFDFLGVFGVKVDDQTGVA